MSETIEALPRIDLAAAHEALAVACESRTLRGAPRQLALLRYAVEEVLAGRGASLNERSIAASLGLQAGFDPKIDPSVRVLASRLRARLARYYAGEGSGDRIRFTFPTGGYEPVIVAVPDEAIDRRPVVVVTTFTVADGTAEVEAFARGISESLAVAISRFRGARTIGPLAGAMARDRVEAARALSIEHAADLALFGSLRIVDDAVRITVWLLQASSGIVWWADQFDGDLVGSTGLAAEDRIVERLASVLADEFGLIPAAFEGAGSAGESRGHRAMLDFYAYARSLDEARRPAVIASLEAAVERAPGHAPYLGALAAVLAFTGVGTVLGASQDPAALDRSESLVRRALAIDPSEPYACLVGGYLRLIAGDVDDGRDRVRSMLAEGRATPAVRSMCGVFLCLSDAWDEGIAELRASHDLNPALPSWQHGFLMLDDLLVGDPAGALDHARLVDTPGLIWGPMLRAAAHGALREVEQAAAELQLVGGFPMVAPDAEELMRGHMRLPDRVIDAVLSALAAIEDPST